MEVDEQFADPERVTFNDLIKGTTTITSEGVVKALSLRIYQGFGTEADALLSVITDGNIQVTASDQWSGE